MATVKISDLAVGDWVMCEDVYCKVAYILPNGIIGTTCRNDRDGYEDPLTNLRPIPITAEILERNGWRILEKEVLGEDYEYEGGERVWDDGNCSIEICEEKQGVFWYSWSNEYYMWRLEYVHQLQHLIRLAGVDKEINL